MKTRKMKNVRPVDSDQALPAKHPTITLTDVVSLADLKEFAKKLPPTYRSRELILEMDDSMPRWMAVGQLLVIDKILRDDLNSR